MLPSDQTGKVQELTDYVNLICYFLCQFCLEGGDERIQILGTRSHLPRREGQSLMLKISWRIHVF